MSKPCAAPAWLHRPEHALATYDTIVIGGGLPAIGAIGLTDLGSAHGRWQLHDARQLGSDRLEVYERTPCSPA